MPKELTQTRLSMLQDLIEDGIKYPVDNERFVQVLNISLNLLNLTENDVAHCMGVSVLNVQKWKQSDSLPFKMARLRFYNFVQEKLKT